MQLDLSFSTILLVDDEHFSRQTIATMLTRLGDPRIQQMENGEQALNYLQDRENDATIVISDFKMPLMDGLQLLRCVRTGDTAAKRSTPFALVTGYSDKHIVDEALALDVNAFLIKPLSKRGLVNRLQWVMDAIADTSWLSPVEHYRNVHIARPRKVESAEAGGENRPAKKLAKSSRVQHRGAAQTASPAGGGGASPRSPAMSQAELMELNAEEFAGFHDESFRIAQILTAIGEELMGSDLLGRIVTAIDNLIDTVGEDETRKIVEGLNELEEARLLSLDDIAGMLGKSPVASPEMLAEETADGGPAPAPVKPKAGEQFCQVDEIPANAVLSRDLLGSDNKVFIPEGTVITKIGGRLISCLDQLHLLSRQGREHDEWGAGIYVLPAGAGDTIAPEAEIEIDPSTLAFQGEEFVVSPSQTPEAATLSRDFYTTDGRLHLMAGSEVSPRMVDMLADLHKLGKVGDQIWLVREEGAE